MRSRADVKHQKDGLEGSAWRGFQAEEAFTELGRLLRRIKKGCGRDADVYCGYLLLDFKVIDIPELL